MSGPDTHRRGAGLPSLMLVADHDRGGSPARVAAAIRGGVQLVQLRAKTLHKDQLAMLYASICRLVPDACQPLWLFNDAPELAASLGAGLHLPAASPTPSRQVRARLGLLGRSAHDPDEVSRALAEGVDYLVIGTLYPTPSKPGRRTLGLSGLQELVTMAADTPVYAIGGIDGNALPAILATGAHGIAVTGALLDAPAPADAAASLCDDLQRATGPFSN